jgi:type 1 glutamine amidotransferase
MKLRSVLLTLAAAVTFPLLAQPSASPRKIQVLIVTGRDDHDWRGATALMRQYLDAAGIFEVRTAEEFRDAGPDSLGPYDVAVLVYNDKASTDQLAERPRKALVEWVQSGKGLVLYHHTLAGFKDWPEFARLSGGNYYRGAQHSPLHDFTVEFTDRDHPITRGLRKSFSQINDELYSNMQMQPAGTYHVLAQAWDDNALYNGRSRVPLVGPGKNEPMMWTVPAGAGRVFATTIGHGAKQAQSDGFRATFTRGVEWAATMTITWRTEKAAAKPQVQYAIASPSPAFANDAKSVAAKASSLNICCASKSVATYRATIEGLIPGTRYLYRAGDAENWGEWNSFNTANAEPAKFRFIYVGDAQNDIKSLWSRTIRSAYSRAPRAAFILHAGDLVSSGYRDDLWGEWYDAMGFIAANMPMLPIPGNHETEKAKDQPKSLSLPAIWKQQFAYPANGPDLPDNESYCFDYQGARFIGLNANMLENEKEFEANRPVIRQEAAWLESVLKNNKNRWTVVFQHQGMYSMAHGRDYVKMREVLLPLYDQYHVDLVLQGHDHVYARSRKLAGGQVVANDAPGTVYMISVSGPKMYELDQLYAPLQAKVLANTQMFQTVEIDGDKLVLQAYSSEGELLDGFQLMKNGDKSTYSELAKKQ